MQHKSSRIFKFTRRPAYVQNQHIIYSEYFRNKKFIILIYYSTLSIKRKYIILKSYGYYSFLSQFMIDMGIGGDGAFILNSEN